MKCLACPRDVNSIESHHVVPVAYGGKKDGLQIPICEDCHTTIHRCIENVELAMPVHLAPYIEVGRLAKTRFKKGELEARDRRPTLLIPMTPEAEEHLKVVARLFNTKSRSATMLAALKFTALNAARVK